MAAGIGLAILVQQRQPEPAGIFLLWFGVAGLLFVLGAAGPQTPAKLSRATRLWSDRYGHLPGYVILGVGGAALLAGAATLLLWGSLASSAGLVLWLASMAVLVAGVWPLLPPRPNDPGGSPGSAAPAKSGPLSIPVGVETVILLLILAAAFAVRFWDLPAFPNGLQSDEGNNGMDALKWLSGAPYTPYSEVNEGQATLFTYLIALSFKFLGVSMTSLRLASVVVGVLTVLAFHFLARESFHPLAALAGTALFAFSRWHITFSRIVYELILVPLAAILVFHFLHRGLRHHRARDFVLAGLAFALGMNSYTAFRVFPAGVALLLIYWLLFHRQRIWATLQGAALFGLSALIGLIPLAIYTLQRPDVVMLRTRKLNVMGEVEAVGSLQPLWTNIRNYVSMFNLRGDPVAINNLPGEPMIGLLVAALMVLGLAYALRYWLHPHLFMPLAWIVGVLPAGILSVTLESPSSRRVIGLLPVVYFLVAAVADAALRSGWRLTLPDRAKGVERLVRVAGPVAVAALVAVAGNGEVRTFFDRQITHPSVSQAFSPIESSIGRFMAETEQPVHFIVHQQFRGHSAIRFIADNPDHAVLELGQDLPLPAPLGEDVVYILTASSRNLRFLFEQFYPGGVWMEHRDAFGGVMFNTFTVSQAEQKAATGLMVQLFPADDPDAPLGPPARVDDLLLPPDFAPDFAGRDGERVGVVWRGSLRVAQFGPYRLGVHHTAPFTLRLDGEVLLEGQEPSAVDLDLTAGFHNFELTAQVIPGQPLPSVDWLDPSGRAEPIQPEHYFSAPAPPFGLAGVYYPNNNWTGLPALVRRDIIVASTDSLPSPYSVVWSGFLRVDNGGQLILGTTSDDGSFVYIDDVLVVDNGGFHGAEYQEGSINLEPGLHPIRIEYFQDGGSHVFELLWTLPNGGGRQPVPPDHLLIEASP